MHKLLSTIRSKYDFKLVNQKELDAKQEAPTLSELFMLALTLVQVIVVSTLTRFWPFSMFWRSSLFHHDNKLINKIINELQDLTDKIQKPFLVNYCADIGEYYSLKGNFVRKEKTLNEAKFKQLLMNKNKLGSGQVFVRTNDDKSLTILIDKDAYKPHDI